MTDQPTPTTDEGGSPHLVDDRQLVRVRSDRVVLVGLGLWALALVACLLVPSWHSGDRDWWPWACVSGLVLGALGWVYLRRGRGNAAEAQAPVPVPPSVTRRQSSS